MDLTNWWTDTYKAKDSAEKMWESWQAPHRTMLRVALHLIPAVESLYEIGCGAGPNLRRLQKDHCEVLRLGGSEPADGLRAWASEHLGLTIDNLTLPDVPDTPWESVLSCYALAYCDHDTAATTLQRLRAVTKYLILMEPNAFVNPYQGPGTYSRGGALPEHVHDYPNLLRDTGWNMVWRWPMLPPTDGLNTVIVAELETV